MLADTLRWIVEHRGVLAEAGLRHVELSAAALGLAVAVAVPLGVALTRVPGAAAYAIGAANVLRTIPSLALLVLMLPLVGTGYLPAMIALTLYGVPAILLNTYAGLRSVDPDVVDAAHGQGLSDRQVVRRIEVPLALPVVFAGIRTAAVQIVAAATLAAFVGGGGLGELITAGMGTLDFPELIVGALAVAALAAGTEILFAGVERLATRRRAAA
ncbi:MAG TPA: ABC transporter permease [Beijerinckiaceae bacterium]|jgi:osmoprotectant transport system permease protein